MAINAKIIGYGCYLPERILTNADLEKMVDTSDEWIVKRTGIKERRVASKEVCSSDLAFEAAKSALENAKITAEDIDLILVATSTPDMHTPSVSCLLQAKLGITNIPALDINSACTGFISALSVAQQFIATGQYKRILVVGVDNLSKMVDYKDRNTCILFGDGAGGVVLEASKDSGGIIQTYLGADGAGGRVLTSFAFAEDENENLKRVSGLKHTLWMDGSEVLKFAVRIMVHATKEILDRTNLSLEDIDVLIPHQANIRIVEGALKRLEYDIDKTVVNLDKYGNMAAASIPVALCEALEEGKIKKGDKILLVGFGGGLTWGSAIIQM